MRAWEARTAFGTATAALLAGPTLALGQTAPPREAPLSTDPLRAVVFAGQDAVIDLGPIVPTPAGSESVAPPPAAAKTTPQPPPRFTVTRVAADGARDTRAIDGAELQTLGRPALPPPSVRPPPARERRPLSQIAGFDAPISPQAPAHLVLPSAWTAAGTSPSGLKVADGEVDASAAPDAVSPLVVRSAQANPRKKPRDAPAFGLHDGRRYGDQGRFYVFAGGKGGGVGLNVVARGEAWGADGVSWDRGGFVGQRSAGIGWRKGDVTTSLGWAHEKNRVKGFFGFPSEKDERVALNLTWRPSPR